MPSQRLSSRFCISAKVNFLLAVLKHFFVKSETSRVVNEPRQLVKREISNMYLFHRLKCEHPIFASDDAEEVRSRICLHASENGRRSCLSSAQSE